MVPPVIQTLPAALLQAEAQMLQGIRANLALRGQAQWPKPDDDLFLAHTEYVVFALQHEIAQRPVTLWLNSIQQEVDATDMVLGSPVHRGAPLYNVGLCYFFLGDYDRSAQYIAQAGEADRRLHGQTSTLPLGHGLSEPIFVDPLDSWLHQEFGRDYQDATGLALTKRELQDLIDFLAVRATDAVVLLAALHRLKSQMEGPDNDASGLHRARALADLLVVLESSLKRILSAPGSLLRQLCNTLTAGTAVGTALGTTCSRHAGENWDLATTVNSMLQTEITKFGIAVTRPERAGIALYVSCRLRNALLHVLDNQLVLYSQPLSSDFKKAAAFALVSIRLGMLYRDSQLGSL